LRLERGFGMAELKQKPIIERAGRRMSVGRRGEALAVSYLEDEGYEILVRNFTCRQGEIDIIAKPEGMNMLCFIEVKCRNNYRLGLPCEAVGVRKQQNCRHAATVYLMREWNTARADAEMEYRFDVVEVMLGEDGASINHIEDAFS
jgi:putative endonuclease